MNKRKSVILGLILIAFGLWAMLWSLGYTWVSMEQLWPLVAIVLGIFALYTGLTRDPRADDAVWLGTMAILGGGLFLYITLGPGAWEDMAWLWPMFPVMAGVAWFLAWLAQVHKVVNLFLSLIALLVGGVGFAYIYGWVSQTFVLQLAQWWPLVLVIIGVSLVIQFAIQRK